jgi:hypothetical protein
VSYWRVIRTTDTMKSHKTESPGWVTGGSRLLREMFSEYKKWTFTSILSKLRSRIGSLNTALR